MRGKLSIDRVVGVNPIKQGSQAHANVTRDGRVPCLFQLLNAIDPPFVSFSRSNPRDHACDQYLLRNLVRRVVCILVP